MPDEVLALAALAELLRHTAEAKAQAVRSNDPFSPFNLVTGWRINVETHSSITFHDSDGEKTVIVHYRPEGYRFGLPGGEIRVRGRLQEDGRLRAELDGRWLTASVFWGEGTLAVFLGAELHVLRCHDPLALDSEVPAGSDRLLAPMPGRVVEIKVAQGDRVEAGRALLVMEAMKMEHTVIAPVEGLVKEIHVAEGDLVEDGAELIAFEPEEA